MWRNYHLLLYLYIMLLQFSNNSRLEVSHHIMTLHQNRVSFLLSRIWQRSHERCSNQIYHKAHKLQTHIDSILREEVSKSIDTHIHRNCLRSKFRYDYAMSREWWRSDMSKRFRWWIRAPSPVCWGPSGSRIHPGKLVLEILVGHRSCI